MNIEFDTFGETVVLETSAVTINTNSKVYMYNYVTLFCINAIFN